MALNKYKIGDLVKLVDERNTYALKDFYGININKEFMPTAADITGVDEKKYKVVRKNRFVYSGMQTGRDKCIRIGLFMKENPVIVSPAYTTFEIKKEETVIPEYFFMKFLSIEKDRLGWFYSDSSVRSNLDWDRFCDIDLELPSVEIQKKYVAIYKAMIENQKSYERGLEDLKLACDAYIENLRKERTCERIGNYINEKNDRNNLYITQNVKGVENSNNLVPTKADTQGLDFHNYKLVEKNDFVYNPSRINIGSIALAKEELCIVSPMYVVFEIIKNKELLPEYLILWLTRKEFFRSTKFFASGSVRDSFNFSEMQEVKIPIPDIKIQQDIVNIYKTYILRKEINEKLKEQIKNICPILIKGSIEEAKSN